MHETVEELKERVTNEIARAYPLYSMATSTRFLEPLIDDLYETAFEAGRQNAYENPVPPER